MTPWAELDAAAAPLDVRAAAARVVEVSHVDRALYLRRVREAQARVEREAAGLLDLSWECAACGGAVRVVGRKQGRELGCCARCAAATSREK